MSKLLPNQPKNQGDVVVSKPGKQDGGVIQYDFGRTTAESRFVRNGSFNAPPAVLLSAVNALQARHNLRGNRPFGDGHAKIEVEVYISGRGQ
jgi:hypothetical protein